MLGVALLQKPGKQMRGGAAGQRVDAGLFIGIGQINQLRRRNQRSLQRGMRNRRAARYRAREVRVAVHRQ